MPSIKQNFYDLHKTFPFLKFAKTAIYLFYIIFMNFEKMLLRSSKKQRI